MNTVTIKAPAKINTYLEVLGLRPDGYHEIAMVMEKIALHDVIMLQEISSGIELVIEGSSDDGMNAEKNLVWRAAKAFKEITGEKSGVRISLKKMIPIAAGLGGGSSDAASTLLGLNELWKKGLSKEKLAEIGSKLGADVPFFCYDGAAFVEGIGDKVTPLNRTLPKMYILLINPGFAVSTPWVYKQWDNLPKNKDKTLGSHVKDECIQGLTVASLDARVPPLFETFRDVTANLKNDLEEVTVSAYPEVGKIKEFLSENRADGVMMSGSGPSVFGLFEDKKSRDLAFSKAKERPWKVFSTEN